jgi:spore coat protein A, manganese oxidase
VQVYAGLVGLYVIRDSALERSLGLPVGGDYEMPLVMMDRALNADGSLSYPGEDPDDSIVPEFFGNISVVNGQAWPRMSVRPARYRFRLLGGGNSRFWNIRLYGVDADTNEPNMADPGPGFTVIGTEGGLLHKAVPVPDWMLVAPAERYDIVIDFSSSPVGTVYSLVNNGGTPYSGPGEESGDEVPLPEVMRFEVVDWDEAHPASAAPPPLPATLAPASAVAPLPIKPHTKTWRIDMSEYEDERGRLMLLLEGAHCEEPIKTKPVYRETSYFEFINTTPDYHPMHVSRRRARRDSGPTQAHAREGSRLPPPCSGLPGGGRQGGRDSIR